jgi:DNA invertase Pin-like site-specific DNA recombinase
MSPELLIVVYERVSTERQDLSRQAVQRERAQADYPGREPLVLQDDGVSAFKVPIFERPGGSELVRLIEEERVEAIYADAQDRLSRGRQSEWWNFADLCQQAGTRIVIDGRELRFEEESDEIRSAIDAILARRESREKSHRVRGGMRRRVERGDYVGAHRSFGYESAGTGCNRRQVINAAEAAVVVRMVEESESGRGLRPIAAGLNADAVPTLRGRAWTPEKVRRLLRARRIAGLEPGYPPIIEPERWQRLQETLSNRRATGRRPYGSHAFTQGILRCPQCGAGLRPRTEKTGYAYYECRRTCDGSCKQGRINAREVESEVLAFLGDLVFDPDEMRTRTEAAAARERGRATHMIEQAQRGVREFERRVRRVQRDYEAGDLPAHLYAESRASLEADREQAEARAAELREAAAEAEAAAADIDAQREVAARLEALQATIRGDRRDAATVEEIRRGLRECFAEITHIPGPDGSFTVRARPSAAMLERLSHGQAESRGVRGQDHGHGELHH